MTTRWGILATGRIARDFATNLRSVPEAVLAAVGSRSLESAEASPDMVVSSLAQFPALLEEHLTGGWSG